MATTLDPIFTGMANGPETIDKNFQALNTDTPEFSADSATGYGTWYGEVHYRRVGRVCTASYNLKGGSKPSSGDMVSVPDWAVPLGGSVDVAGETADANVTTIMFANARIDGPSKKMVTSWIAGNIFIASITYVCA